MKNKRKKVGLRGAIMEEIMNGIMYEIPSANGVVSADVTKECVDRRQTAGSYVAETVVRTNL